MEDQARRGRLRAVLDDAAAGRFPPADGGVTILPPPSARDAGVIGFTAHAVIFTDADPAWVAAQLPADDLSGPLAPAFLQALCERTNRQAHTIDMLCAAPPLPGPPALALTPEPDLAHPRIARAMRYRDQVRAWRAGGGVVLVGQGVAGRWETAVEVDPGHRGRGLGRALAAAARHLVPGGAPVWAQIAPANAASVRAFLAAGFRPVAAEAHLTSSGLGE
ncbi:MAG TPA: GNAT family N-acetyltransferase [Streptosporangiaceae bacterium]|nr:GNAT family N-acetyltransferase [Streptosporangiaceae bacterium]